MRDVDAALEVLAFAPHELTAEEAIEANNIVSAHFHALERDTPAKTWWNADANHPAIARALRIDRQALGAPYALIPFRLWNDGERHVILAAHPTPRCLGPVDLDWLGIESVIAWDPRKDTATLLPADDALVGNFGATDAGTLFASPRDFFTEWMRARAAFFVRWCESRRGEWAHGAIEFDLAPGKLIVGDVEKTTLSGLPETLHCRGIAPQQVNRAIIKRANLPRAVSQEIREVA
jgi:hypothetical protein